jgi:hypothetical protein
MRKTVGKADINIAGGLVMESDHVGQGKTHPES